MDIEKLTKGIAKRLGLGQISETILRDYLRSELGGTCKWTYDAEDNCWNPTCSDQCHDYDSNGPIEHGEKFCCYCGKRIEEVSNGQD